MNLNSYMPVKQVTGAGCVRASGKELAGFGRVCLIVTGRSSARACGALQDVTDTLDGNGQSWVLFDGIGQNPKLTDCMAAAEQAIEAGADFILGIGGGSALDAAKCIAVLAANPGMTQEPARTQGYAVAAGMRIAEKALRERAEFQGLGTDPIIEMVTEEKRIGDPVVGILTDIYIHAVARARL